ncbi:ATP-dependent RNA helicase DOB1 [Dendrobium catenatum]|uniref:ATP-dependent RNA helicase DOB1 n=1 Tax=Dendrobium catenatum TaxID=906689 RepID=A0A2I0X173_9ASPA|nr:ATP-dependent RNA helicase DOB1 [Dendrobium catenatum]
MEGLASGGVEEEEQRSGLVAAWGSRKRVTSYGSLKMEMDVLKDMVLGKPAPLVSTFRLSYYTILNLVKRAEGQFTAEHVIKNSFHQFQYEKSLPDMNKKISKLETEAAMLESSGETELTDYHNLGLEIAQLERKIMSEITRPERILYYLVPGRLVLSGIPCGICEIRSGSCTVASNIRHEQYKNSFPPDLRPAEARQTVLLAVQELHKKFPHGLPRLNPVKDMGINDPELTELVHKFKELEQKLAAHPLHVLQKFRDELKNRSRVLKRLGHIDADSVVQLKGRAACLIDTGDELLVTELMLNGVSLHPSTFNVSIRIKLLPLQAALFLEINQVIKETIMLIALNCVVQHMQIQHECKLDINVEEYVESTLKAAAHAVGEINLEKKFESGTESHRRGIMFANSLAASKRVTGFTIRKNRFGKYILQRIRPKGCVEL